MTNPSLMWLWRASLWAVMILGINIGFIIKSPVTLGFVICGAFLMFLFAGYKYIKSLDSENMKESLDDNVGD